jgi:hypothetical protein
MTYLLKEKYSYDLWAVNQHCGLSGPMGSFHPIFRPAHSGTPCLCQALWRKRGKKKKKGQDRIIFPFARTMAKLSCLGMKLPM